VNISFTADKTGMGMGQRTHRHAEMIGARHRLSTALSRTCKSSKLQSATRV
jgi:hypothetical protein